MNYKNLELVKSLRHRLHENPELSNSEKVTKKILMDFLKENTNIEIVDRGLWFYAKYKAEQSKGNIGFRADFDALPMDEGIDLPHGSRFEGIAHKCGHDGHAATLVGLALEINQIGCEKDVYFIFQHAEETGDGGESASELIVEKNIQEIYAYHNWSGTAKNSISIIEGTANFASKGMTITMIGSPSHASQPEFGKNPSNAISTVVNSIPQYTSSDITKGLVLCTIVQINVGEKAFGMSASKGQLLMTIRAEHEKEMDKLQKNIELKAAEQAEMYGLSVEFRYSDEFPETVNNAESIRKVRDVARDKGFQIFEMAEPIRGSEDFGHYLKKTAGAIFYIGNGEEYPELHTYKYDFNDDIIETAVEMFKSLAGLE